MTEKETTPRDPGARLHMFEMGEDYVVAFDLEDAWAVWSEVTGCIRGDDLEEDAAIRILDDLKIKCWVDTTGTPCDHGEGVLQEHTAERWTHQLGRGFAFSNNF
jgi:hypothetical protein